MRMKTPMVMIAAIAPPSEELLELPLLERKPELDRLELERPELPPLLWVTMSSARKVWGHPTRRLCTCWFIVSNEVRRMVAV